MPTAQSDGCPINYEVEGPQNAPVLMLCNSHRHQSAHVGRPGSGLRQAIPPGALRPPRSRQVRRAEGSLHDGTCSAAMRSPSPTPSAQKVQLVRPLDGRHGRAMARRQRARPRRQARHLQHAFLLRRQAALARPHQVRDREGPGRSSPTRMMERWFTPAFRASPPDSGPRARHVHATPARRLRRLLPGGPRHGLPGFHQRPSPRRPWSWSGARTRRRCRRYGQDITQDDQGFEDRHRWKPRICPTSSSPRPTPTPC